MTARSPGFINIPSSSGLAKISGARKEEGLHILKNNHGLKAAVANGSGKLVSLTVPDAKGKGIDVLAGFTGDFQTIARGFPKFEPDGKNKVLEKNGLQEGIDDKKSRSEMFWDTGPVNTNTLELTCFSQGMHEHFPGYPRAKVHYALMDDDRLKISYEATIEQINALNLADNFYFNLNGAGSVLNHLVQIGADSYIPINSRAIPAGEIEPVSGTPFDFRKATTIGARINDNSEQLKNGKGYNHIFVLNKHSSRTPIARIKGDKSGIIMEICTEQQGLYFYSCNLMQSAADKNGDCRNAFALGAMHFPRQFNTHLSPNAKFDDDQIYKFVYVYRFKTGK